MMESSFRAVSDAVERWPMGLRAAATLAMTLSCSFVDFWSGAEVSFSLFYLVPVVLATWFVGRGWGLFLTLLSAIEWHIANQAAAEHFSHPLIPYWNTLTRMMIFAVVALLLAQIRKDLALQKTLANTDFLTGALSRRAFYERIQSELARKTRQQLPLTLAYLDVDNFKGVNDTYGHGAGDELLQAVAHSMRRQLRSSDAVARLGGDEFAVLLPDTSADHARAVVEDLRANLDKEMRLRDWPVTFSIGVLTCEQTPASIPDMVKMTDQLMYAVKHGGKDRIQVQTF